MRRLARHAFTALSALSLLLCVAVAVVWSRNWVHTSPNEPAGWRAGIVVRERGPAPETYRAARGDLVLVNVYDLEGGGFQAVKQTRVRHDGTILPPGTGPAPVSVRGLTAAEIVDQIGRRHVAKRDQLRIEVSIVMERRVLPYIVPVACLAVMPTSWSVSTSRRIRQRRRIRSGHCPKCRYDLRASPGQCPECGAANPGKVSLEI
jgi:hypothetical protein